MFGVFVYATILAPQGWPVWLQPHPKLQTLLAPVNTPYISIYIFETERLDTLAPPSSLKKNGLGYCNDPSRKTERNAKRFWPTIKNHVKTADAGRIYWKFYCMKMLVFSYVWRFAFHNNTRKKTFRFFDFDLWNLFCVQCAWLYGSVILYSMSEKSTIGRIKIIVSIVFWPVCLLTYKRDVKI